MLSKSFNDALLIVIVLVLAVFDIYLYNRFSKLNSALNDVVSQENPLRKENELLKNEIEQLEIIKQYEIDKALSADDSTTYLLWKQLLSE